LSEWTIAHPDTLSLLEQDDLTVGLGDGNAPFYGPLHQQPPDPADSTSAFIAGMELLNGKAVRYTPGSGTCT
jgi:hypothetical protein